MKSVLSVQGVSKTYRRGDQNVVVLGQVDLEVDEGDFVSLMGPSGSGKTTLLNIIGGIDSPTTGRVVVAGTDIAELDDARLSRWRTANVGFVFQQYNLLPVMTAAENVELPLLLYPMSSAERRRRTLAALEVVGLEPRADHYPRQMSGGEEQRTAIARALVTDPKLLIADEPTGNLDATAAERVLELLQMLNRDYRKTILMVTHDPGAAAKAQHLVRLQKGQLVLESASPGRS